MKASHTWQSDVNPESATLIRGTDGSGDGAFEVRQVIAAVEVDANAGNGLVLIAFRQLLLHPWHVQHLQAIPRNLSNQINTQFFNNLGFLHHLLSRSSSRFLWRGRQRAEEKNRVNRDFSFLFGWFRYLGFLANSTLLFILFIYCWLIPHLYHIYLFENFLKKAK